MSRPLSENDRALVVAYLRCAAESDLHQVHTELLSGGRLDREIWSAFYAAGNNALRAAELVSGEIAGFKFRDDETPVPVDGAVVAVGALPPCDGSHTAGICRDPDCRYRPAKEPR